MLTTNLGTRPFYNERAVHVALALLGVGALLVLALGAVRLVELSRASDLLTLQAETAERDAAAIGGRAAALEQELQGSGVTAMTDAAAAADRLIAQRGFSWTAFFDLIDRTLPSGVMLTAVRPDAAADGLVIELSVVGRSVAEIDQFIGQLEATGAFEDVLARQEELADDGTYRAQVRGRIAAGAAGVRASDAAEDRS